MATYQAHSRLTACFKVMSAITLTAGCLSASGNHAVAQSNIVPDASLGAESSFVVPNFSGLAVEAIGGGAVRGQNLFHSFQEFNVSEGRGAYFFSPNANIQNILARVTGGNRSDILGVLGTFGNSQPNLFLINPNGIFFGPNAQLNVGGSFFASTANSVVYDNGYQFSASNPQAPPLLTINVPLGVQYGANPGRIVNQSVVGLQVQTGKTLALVGGEVDLEGAFLYAPDGRIELGSVAGNNQVNLTPTSMGYALNYGGVGNFQDIRLTQEAFISTGGNSGGSIQVQGKNVTLTDGSQISANVLGAGVGGGLTVNASESVQVIGRSADGQFPSGLFAQARQRATGQAGDLTITTGQLLIRDGAAINASTFSSGKGGNLTVNADSVQVIGRSADGEYASNLAALANPNSTGNAGDLKITTSRLLIQGGAQVSASTAGTGKGGNLTVNASDSVQVIGRSANSRFGSTLSAQANQGIGNAGDLSITTSQFLIRDGARVSASTFSSGKGGNLTINASDSVQVIGTRSGLFVGSATESTAGNLSLKTGQISVQDSAQVTVSSPFGQAGNMTITADSLTLNRGTISAETAKSTAEGGANITLQGLDLLRMDNESLISATALEDAKGGNVTIDSTLIVATPPKGPQGSDIIANADRGNGGSINITTQGLFGIEFRPQRTPKNDITVSSNFGLAGVYTQTTPAVDPSRGLAELPANVVDASQQIDRRCTSADRTRGSSFTITGRGGLPPSPNDPLLYYEEIVNWVTLEPGKNSTNPVPPQTNPSNTAPKQLVEAQSWVYGPNGEVILVAEAPTATPHNSWQTPPSCEDLQSSAN